MYKSVKTINSGMDLPLVNPLAKDQSNKEQINNVSNWVQKVVSSKVQRFHSLHNVHNKHKETKLPDIQRIFAYPIPPAK